MNSFTRRHLVLLVLLVVLPLIGGAKETYRTVIIRNDSLPLEVVSHWRYQEGDDARWAQPNYSDSGWSTRASYLGNRPDSLKRGRIPDVAWFRIWLKADNALAKQALALSMQNSGRKEYYLDGLRIQTTGDKTPGNDTLPDNTLTTVPVIFMLPDTAEHLLAIRFSYSAPDKLDYEGEERRGISFRAHINTAPRAIKNQIRQTLIVSSFTIFYFSFFFAFGVIHLLLFLFHRAVLSNLWFSVFCFGLGVISLVGFLAAATGFKQTEQLLDNYGTLVIAATCAAISAFVNDLFGRGWWRYRIAQATVLCGIVCLFYDKVEEYILPVLILLVAVEAIVLIIKAIYRKVPGARIVGAGFLFFALTIVLLLIVVAVATTGTNATKISGILGLIIVVATVFATVSIPLSVSAYLAWGFATTSRNLGRQLVEVERLSGEARQHEAEKQHMMQSRQEELEHVVSVRTEELRGQKEKSDELLRNILPAEVAEELKEKGTTTARLYDNVSVLFTDFADFTQRAERLSATELVAELDECFSAFDSIITRHGLEKIKTVGDAYIAVSGLPVEEPRHAHKVVTAALEILDYMHTRRTNGADTFDIRLGIHSGPVVAGIVGVKKFAYDIWGDTVNTAARMEQHSEPGKINISAATYAIVSSEFQCSYRGELEAKHKGRLGMYFVEGQA
jgi:adenylate cyclase